MNPERILEPWNTTLPNWQYDNDSLCRSFVFEEPYAALDFVIGLCRLVKRHQQNLAFRVRAGLVVVQSTVPAEGASDALLQLAKDLDDLRSHMS